MELRYNTVKRAAYLYLSLPSFIFFIGFLRWPFALVCTAVMAAALFLACRPLPSVMSEKTIRLHLWEPLLLLAVMLLWGYLGGLNGYFYQSSDWPYRNAIFRDLIEYDWPVTYPSSSTALVYYIGFWLPPAALAKLALALSGSEDTAWLVGQMALWVWAALGTALTALLVMLYANTNKLKRRVAAVAIMIGFSGLDIVEAWCSGRLQAAYAPDELHLEWWNSAGYQFSSLTTCLYWVFNQSVVPWLSIACFLLEPDARNYLLLGISCLSSGPFAFVGLVICMAVRWISRVRWQVLHMHLCKTAGGLLSAANVLLLAVVFPVFGLFYITNNAFSLRGSATVSIVSQTSSGSTGVWLLAAVIAVLLVGFAAFLWSCRAPRPEPAHFRSSRFSSAQERRRHRQKRLAWAVGIALALFAAGVIYEILCAAEVVEFDADETPFLVTLWNYFTPKLFLFYFLEVGIYMLLLYKNMRRDPVFHAVAVSLLLIPYVRIGTSMDFAMRASIPGIFLLMAYCVRALASGADWKIKLQSRDRTRYLALVLALCLGAVTPITEVGRGIYHAVSEGTVLLANDTVGSIETLGVTTNFSASNYMEKAFFYYLAKPTDKVMLSLGDGIYGEEKTQKDEAETAFHWCQETAELEIGCDYDGERDLALQFVLGLRDRSSQINATIQVDGETYRYQTIANEDGTPSVVTIPLTLSRGAHTVTITTDLPRLQVKGETRNLYFSIGGIRLLDGDGALLYGTKARYPDKELAAVRIDESAAQQDANAA